MAQDDDFEAYRSHLFGVAYRMLGSRAEAEDAVQETWLRYAAASPRPDHPRAWLTTVISRICLDELRSARARREAYVGSWLPEPLVTRLPVGLAAGPPATDADPADAAVRRDQVGMALLVVLERLTPEQRVAFVLHDVFAVPFDTIAAALDTTPAAARQLATRARQAVDAAGPPKRTADQAEQRRVLTAFIEAATRGDLAGLTRVLAPEVVLTGDGAGLAPAVRHPIEGAQQVARFLLGLFRQADRRLAVYAETVLVNGDLGFVVDGVLPDGTPDYLVVLAPVVVDGRIVAIYNQLNPEKLTAVPRPDPATASWPPRI